MNKEDCLTKLTEFKDLLVSLDYVSSIEQMTSIRSEINKKKHITMKIMSKAHTLKTVTIGPPPAVGGMIMKNLNPLDIIFDPPYGRSIIPSLIDMLDETIGAIEEDDNFFLEDRKDKTRKETKTRKIFIVHGHDDTMKLDVSNVLRQLDFEPIILNDKASGGKTIIEKIRERVQDAVIRTSLITGFPGETDDDFDKLLTFIKNIFRFIVFPHTNIEIGFINTKLCYRKELKSN